MKLHVSIAQPKLPSWEGRTRERSRVNISNEMKLPVSSHSPRDRGEAVNTQPRLPKREVQRVQQGPTLSLGQLMQVRYQHPPASLPSYQARCGHKLQLPSWEVQQHGRASPRCVSDWRTTPQSSLEVGSKNVDSRQHKIRDSHHVSQRSYQRSFTNKYRVDQSTCHKCFKAVLRSSAFCINMMHHSQG